MTKRQAGIGTVVVAWAIVVGGAAAVAQTSAQAVKDDLFAGTEKFAQGASSVSEIDMPPGRLAEIEGKNSERARRIVLSIVHTYQYDKPGMYKMEDVEVFRKKLQTGDWHCSVHVFESKTGESTDVCSKHRTDDLREDAIMTVSPKSLTFIHSIRRESPHSDAGGSAIPLQMRLPDPEIQAEMAIAHAQMQAEMATLGPQLQAQLAGLKNFQGPDPAEMQRLREQMKNFHGPVPAEMQHLRDQLKEVFPRKNEAPKQAP